MSTIAHRVAEALADQTTALRLTLLVLVLRPPAAGALRGLTWLVAGVALVVPAVARAAVVWFVLAALVAARLVVDWPLADNHIYLLGYWCLGIGLCLGVTDGFQAIGSMSRWLLGTAFLCAIVWKGILAPEFLDARFFRMTLLTDDRFADVSNAIGGVSEQQLQINRAALVALPPGADVIDGPILQEPRALRRLGIVLTWCGFILEASLALAFLSPWPAALHRGRHVLLLIFAVTTYAIAPVAGFGWLLMAMGLAQSDVRQDWLRLAYVGVFMLVLVYAETPLIPMLLGAMKT